MIVEYVSKGFSFILDQSILKKSSAKNLGRSAQSLRINDRI